MRGWRIALQTSSLTHSLCLCISLSTYLYIPTSPSSSNMLCFFSLCVCCCSAPSFLPAEPRPPASDRLELVQSPACSSSYCMTPSVSPCPCFYLVNNFYINLPDLVLSVLDFMILFLGTCMHARTPTSTHSPPACHTHPPCEISIQTGLSARCLLCCCQGHWNWNVISRNERRIKCKKL